VLFLMAGVLGGAGSLLLAQVIVAERVRDQVESSGPVLRAVADATFFLQSQNVQAAIAVANVVPGSLEHSRRVAITLLVVAGLLLVSMPFLRGRRKRG
jgi:hypothetical protein